MNYRKKIRLGDVLMSRGLINQNQLNMALKEQKEKGRMLGEMLVELGYVTQEKINDILCEMLNIEFIDLQVEEPEENVRDLIPEEVMRKYTLVPMRYDKNNAGVIQVAMADPMNILAMDDINIITGKQVAPYLANASDIRAYFDRVFGKKQAQNIAEMYKKEQGLVQEESEEEKLRKEDVENAPIVQLVNSIIEQAARQRASDIHIEPFEESIRVRYRVDGVLREVIEFDKSLVGAITA